MSQSRNLIVTLKRLLKAKGVTYAAVAAHLQLSEASVKRQFAQFSLSLPTLESVSALIGLELYELVQEAECAQSRLHNLTTAQEAELVSEPGRLLTAVCLLNHWPVERIVATYRLSEAQCVSHLAQLDRLELIKLLPANRIKLNIARDFRWLPDGPIQRFFQQCIQDDFLRTRFEKAGEQLCFHHAMLTPEANARFQQRVLRLLREFDDLHEECKTAPEDLRFGTSLLVAMRPWEPSAFEALRRQPDQRSFR